MDESRRDRHQRILGECLSKIQHDFSDQKQQLHRHLIDGLQWQLAQLQNGSHPEFLYLAGLPSTTTPATTTPATTTTINRRKQPVITTSQSGLLKSLMTNSKLERERAEVVWRAEYWRDYMLSLTDALHRQEIATIDAEYRVIPTTPHLYDFMVMVDGCVCRVKRMGSKAKCCLKLPIENVDCRKTATCFPSIPS